MLFGRISATSGQFLRIAPLTLADNSWYFSLTASSAYFFSLSLYARTFKEYLWINKYLRFYNLFSWIMFFLRKINHTGWILLTTHLKLLFVTHEIHFLSSLLCTQGNIKETGVGLNRIRMKLLRGVGVTQAGKYSQTDDRMIGWWVCKKRGAHLTPASSSQTHKAPQHF